MTQHQGPRMEPVQAKQLLHAGALQIGKGKARQLHKTRVNGLRDLLLVDQQHGCLDALCNGHRRLGVVRHCQHRADGARQ